LLNFKLILDSSANKSSVKCFASTEDAQPIAA
jgi:hypothetical protein